MAIHEEITEDQRVKLFSSGRKNFMMILEFLFNKILFSIYLVNFTFLPLLKLRDAVKNPNIPNYIGTLTLSFPTIDILFPFTILFYSFNLINQPIIPATTGLNKRLAILQNPHSTSSLKVPLRRPRPV